MSDWGTSTGPRGPLYRTQLHGHPHHQIFPPTRMHAGPSAGQPHATWHTISLPAEGGRTPGQYQYSDHLFQGMQHPYQAHARLDTSQARTSLGTGVGVSRAWHQPPFDSGPHRSTHPADHLMAPPPRGGELHTFPISHGSPVAYEQRMPVLHSNVISSPGGHTHQSDWQGLAQPQRPQPHESLQLVYGEDFMYTPSSDICPFPQCLRTCGRPQDLERHARQHLPHCIYCSQPGCNWTGNRRYALRDHMKRKHPGLPLPEQVMFLIYDANAIVKQLLNQEITAERAVHHAFSLFQNKAVQLGKLGIWRG